jgi:hypothetical protein
MSELSMDKKVRFKTRHGGIAWVIYLASAAIHSKRAYRTARMAQKAAERWYNRHLRSNDDN